LTPFIISVFLFDVVFKTVTYSDIDLQNYAGAMAGEGLRYRGNEGENYLGLYTLVNGVYQEYKTASIFGEELNLDGTEAEEEEEEEDSKNEKPAKSEVTNKGTCSFKSCNSRRRLAINPYE